MKNSNYEVVDCVGTVVVDSGTLTVADPAQPNRGFTIDGLSNGQYALFAVWSRAFDLNMPERLLRFELVIDDHF